MQAVDESRENCAAIARILECRIYERTHGRISGVRVEALEDRVVVHGRAKTYHVKQLALAAIREMSPFLVQLDIHVDPAQWRRDRRLDLE
jgi:hypothetical protein